MHDDVGLRLVFNLLNFPTPYAKPPSRSVAAAPRTVALWLNSPSKRAIPPVVQHPVKFRLDKIQPQPLDVPFTRSAFDVQDQRAKLAERLVAPGSTTDEGPKRARLHPAHRLAHVDAIGANLHMDVDVHVQRRVPELAQATHELGRVRELGAVPGLKVADHGAVPAQRSVAKPARKFNILMLVYVLRGVRCKVCVFGRSGVTYDLVLALVVRLVIAFGAVEARFPVRHELGSTGAYLSAIRAIDVVHAGLVVLVKLRLAGKDFQTSFAAPVIFGDVLFEHCLIRRVEVTARL